MSGKASDGEVGVWDYAVVNFYKTMPRTNTFQKKQQRHREETQITERLFSFNWAGNRFRKNEPLLLGPGRWVLN
jgi:hypothetical protein